MNKKIKVLFVGVQSRTQDAGPGYHRENRLVEILRSLGVCVDMMDVGHNGWFFRGATRQFRFAWRSMPWDEYDYFHVPSAIVANILACRRRHGAKIIYDCQGLRFAEIQLKNLVGLNKCRVPVMRALERNAAKKCTLCITVSKPLKQWLAEVRGTEKGIEIIRNVVDAEKFTPLSDVQIDRDDIFRVGYAGKFQNWQAVDLLIDAAKELKDNKKIRWRIIGFQKDDQDLKRHFAAEMPPTTELIDLCDRSTLVSLLQECHLLTVPRKSYLACQVALPTKFAEYLAMAKPVLVNTVDETDEIVRENQCGFVAESNGCAIAKAIACAAKIPAEKFRSMGQAGRKYVLANMSLDVVGQRYKEIMEANL